LGIDVDSLFLREQSRVSYRLLAMYRVRLAPASFSVVQGLSNVGRA